MAGYYSILRFVNNPLVDESIALGLVVLPEPEPGKQTQAMFRLSEAKVDFAQKLNPGGAKLLHFALKQLEGFFKQELVDQTNQAVQFPVRVQQAFIERLAAYNNGILQFTQPAYIESDQLVSAFSRYFDRFVEANVPVKSQAEPIVKTTLRQRIETDLYVPMRGHVDVDYTLRKKQLPALYFDYTLDALGVNGAMYAVKAIDLNANHHLDFLQKQLSEFETLLDRLNRFAQDRNIDGNPEYHLVVDPYRGKNASHKELYDILQSTGSFKVNTSSELKRITERMQQKKVKRFSEKLLEG